MAAYFFIENSNLDIGYDITVPLQILSKYFRIEIITHCDPKCMT